MNELDVPRVELSERELALAVEESCTISSVAWRAFPVPSSRSGASTRGTTRSRRTRCSRGVWGTRLAPDDVHAVAEEVLAWYRAREAPFLFWWAGPGTEPDDLGARLRPHGFAPFEIDAQGQIAELRALDWGALARVPRAFVSSA